MMPTTDALEIAVSVLESRGIEIEAAADDSSLMRAFYFPNRYAGGTQQAVVRHLTEVRMLEISVLLNEPGGVVQPVLREGLLQLMNGLHFQLPGVVFTYNAAVDEEDGDEIEMSMAIPYVDPEDVSGLLEAGLNYLERVHQQTVRLFHTYLAQKLRVRLDSAGDIVAVLPSVSVRGVLNMLEAGDFNKYCH